ncbi:hypothetical protein SE17_03620 [Kouleothrix aurantiaca]|jgi:hypothetical protein|uniref:Uncharacterized protein n=1 Tax=Kouleothrix aurantiaca TaxID=186479 RepID=A0A0P9D5X2_9CHLR|nr:hypothetical protein SE17_03620 [Kouleothrix aurantiaca]
MIALEQQTDSRPRLIWLSVVLALLVAEAYTLIGLNILGVGDLPSAERPAAVVYAAAGCYLLGGLLILLRRRWLWVAGLLINTLVMWIFFRAYAARPAVLFSSGGLITKAAQIMLELSLIALIIADRRSARRA